MFYSQKRAFYSKNTAFHPENDYFDQSLGCPATKRWLKYTTNLTYNFMQSQHLKAFCNLLLVKKKFLTYIISNVPFL